MSGKKVKTFEDCKLCPDLYDNYGNVHDQKCIHCQNADTTKNKKNENDSDGEKNGIILGR